MMSFSEQVRITGGKKQVFEAIAYQVQGWWGHTDSVVEKLGDEFTTRFGETYWTFKIMEFEPYSRIVWNCIDARHIHTGYEGIEKEWVGTSVQWHIKEWDGGEVLLYFIHEGLIPALNCYEVCYPAWEFFVTRSLKSLVETGKGMPHLS